ncbi:RNA polymerase sigma factor for flagellar operon [Candidatus Termititenax persephonae]|uniref:RNA polymerase sigma factor for flagellar operon n=1 Tax=Candidatus Termititenax persephonae TaxID=2218525 RepID=A0A388TEU9_9BACT|nr:RNA polymerase sigma factor for flagellar operon [Candidatus Termititenax persephonae]
MADKKRLNPNPPKKLNKAAEHRPLAVDVRQRMYQPNDDPESRINFQNQEEVVAAYTPLVQVIAANITASGKIPPNLSFDDLVSYGTSGLVKSWENFDKNKNVKFKVYASYRIRGEMLDKIRKEWKYQNPGGYKSIHKVEAKVAQAAIDTKGVSKTETEEEAMKNITANSSVAYLLSFEDTRSTNGDSVADNGALLDDSVAEQIDFATEKRALWDAVKTLAEDEKKIIKLFYIDDRSQKEIADELGYSKSKISRLHAQVLNKLRTRITRRLNYDLD